DPRFFMYGEDLDFCYRVQSEGYKVYYVPTTEIIHYKGESTKRSSLDETKIFYEAMHLFVKKHFSSSFLVELILRSAIIARRSFAFLNLYRLPILSALLDFILFSFSLYAAEQLYRPGTWSGFPEGVKPWVYIAPAFLQTIFTALIGGYKRPSISTLKVLASLLVGLVLSSSITFFFKQYAYSRAVLLITYSIAIAVFILWRFIVKIFFNVGVESSVRLTRTLIVGDETKGEELIQKLKTSFTNLYSIVGIISEKTENIGKQIGNYEVLGSFETINKIINEEKINHVIFTSEEISFEKMFSIVSHSARGDVEFLVAGTELDYLVGKTSVTMLDNIPLLKVHYNISTVGHRIIKAIFDIAVSIPMLVFIFPFITIKRLFADIKSDFGNFIMNVPSVIILKKSLIGTKEKLSGSGLYLGKQGLTGLWYIENYSRLDRNDIEKLNIYYAKNQNIWLDLEILGKAFAKMLKKRS
ncbi:MAG: glycosyl transferase, partial [Bacteroidota bacterium]